MAKEDFGNLNVNSTFYKIKYGNTFSNVEENQLNNVSNIAKLDKELSDAGEAGYDKFKNLSKDAKEQLTSLFGAEKSYMQAPKTGWDSFFEGAKNVLINVNPLTWAWRTLELYGKGMSTIQGVAAQAIENNANIFDTDTWSSTWDHGEAIFSNEQDAVLEQKYGKVKAFIAKQSLAGKTPGEIIQAYGTLSDEFLKEIESYVNDSATWEDGVLEDYRQARVSFGRNLARNIFGGRTGKENDSSLFTFVSGGIDAVVTIFTDPLTYVTFGAGKGIQFAGRGITESGKIAAAAKAAGKTGDISKVFQFGKVRSYWDDYGSKIKELETARKAGADSKAAQIVEQIKITHPEHALDSDIQFAINSGIYNAADAERVFSQADNAHKLLNGRASDTTFYRDSIAISKRNRIGSQKIRERWASLGRGDYTEQELNKTKESLLNEYSTLGSEIDTLQRVDTPVAIEQQRRNAEFGNRFIKALSRSPGDEFLLLGDDAVQSADQYRSLAMLLMPKDVANVFVEGLLRSDTSKQLTIIRGMYRGIMESAGIGKDDIERILQNKFGAGGEGMTVSRSVGSIAAWGKRSGEIKVNGALHDWQTTKAVGNMPWTEISKLAADRAFQTGGKSVRGKTSVISTIGGATNGTLVTNMTNAWSLLTLAPKLGIRSSIDEGFLFGLTAPREALLNYFKGRTAGKMITTFTGSNTAVGPVSGVIRKVMKPVVGRWKKNIDPVTAIPMEERLQMWTKILDDLKENSDNLDGAVDIYIDALAMRSVAMYRGLSPEQQRDMIDAVKSSLHFTSSAESSVAAKTGNITMADAARIDMGTMSNLTKMTHDFAAEMGKEFVALSPAQFKENELAFLMFNNLYKRFSGNKLGGNIDMGALFIKHNGLRSEVDIDNAIAEAMTKLDPTTSAGLAIRKRILSERAGTIEQKARGLSDDQALDEILTASFADMYKAFHGSSEGFNDELFNYIKSNIKKPNLSEGLKDVINSFNIDDYQNLVRGHMQRDEIVTNVVKLGDFDNTAGGWYTKFGEQIWHAMDRTATSIVRQPAVTSYYLMYRNKYRAFELANAEKRFETYLGNLVEEYGSSVTLAKDLGMKVLESGDFEYTIPKLMDVLNNPNNYSQSMVKLAERQSDLAAKYFAEVSMKNAVSHTLKYVDNPHIRTNLAGSLKNVNRFYRAIEDFYRRTYRLKDVSSQALFRTRLLHSGLNGAGMIEKDEQGNEYFVLPMDNILFAALDPVFRTLSGGNFSFKQPQFNRLTFRMTNLNPSFQDDAGLPTLSGPTAALSVLALKNVTSRLGTNGEKFSEEIDNILLGDIGDNLDIRKAIMPATVDRVWKMLDTNEQSVYNNTATLSAIAYNQAHGYGIRPDATAEEKAEYLKNVKISGHNLVAIRSFLGLIAPFSPQAQDSMDVPDYIRDNGTINIRQEYFDILDAIMTKYGNDVSDPYELAAAIFVGNNPDKLIYTVSRNNKTIKAMIDNTKQTKDWIISNRDFISAYGDAAYMFAPSGDEYNAGVYNWMQAAGLIENVGAEEYLNRAQVAVDKQLYFDVGQNLDDQLKTTANYQERKMYIDQAQYMRESIRMRNPLLASELDANGFSVNSEKEILNNLRSIVESKNAPISSAQRNRLNHALKIFDKAYTYIQSDSLKLIGGYAQLKLGARDRAMDELYAMSINDPFIKQIVNQVFKPLLKFHSRDSVSALPVQQSYAQPF